MWRCVPELCIQLTSKETPLPLLRDSFPPREDTREPPGEITSRRVAPFTFNGTVPPRRVLTEHASFPFTIATHDSHEILFPHLACVRVADPVSCSILGHYIVIIMFVTVIGISTAI